MSDINKMFDVGNLEAGVPTTVSTDRLDLIDDDTLNAADITEWLSQAATANGYGSPMLRGDTDGLDNMSPTPRTVDITDFDNFFNGFTDSCANWECGNFNGGNVVDITDFSINFLPTFAATGGGTYGPGQSIPEPSTVLLLGLGVALLACVFSREFLATQI